MNLKKLLGVVVVLCSVLLVSFQAATACVANPYEPYNGLWQLESDDAIFSYAVYSPVEDGVMIISSVGGDELYSLPIDEKTYPNFQELQTPDVFGISFAVDGQPVEYTVYDGGWYTGLQLLSDDHTSKYGLIKIKGVEPAAVPIPGAVWLLGAGLAGLIAFRKKS